MSTTSIALNSDFLTIQLAWVDFCRYHAREGHVADEGQEDQEGQAVKVAHSEVVAGLQLLKFEPSISRPGESRGDACCLKDGLRTETLMRDKPGRHTSKGLENKVRQTRFD